MIASFDTLFGLIEEDVKTLRERNVEPKTVKILLSRIARRMSEVKEYVCSVRNTERREESLEALIALAHENGWNGVENSKILEEFYRSLIAELKKKVTESRYDAALLAAKEMEYWNEAESAGDSIRDAIQMGAMGSAANICSAIFMGKTAKEHEEDIRKREKR